jgi:hypothetical protein
MKPLILILSVALLSTISGTAQTGYTLYGLNGVHQASALNPAFAPNAKVQIGLPGLSGTDLRFAHNGFAISDLVVIRPDDSLALDVDGMLGKLQDRNLISVDHRTEVFSIGIGGERGYLSATISERMHLRFGYPRDLMVLAWEGNGGRLLGQRANLDEFALDFTAFREYALGYSFKFNDRLTGGMRLKFLQGHFNTYTRSARLGLFTDATTYDLSFDGGGEVNSSGIEELAANDFDVSELELDRLLFGMENRGMGIDLGVDWSPVERVRLSASLLDVGSITWRHNVRTYDAQDFIYTFSGVDVNQALVDSAEIFQNMLDSLETIIVTGERSENYRTPLNPRVFLTAGYDLSEKLRANVLFHGEVFKTSVLPTLAVSLDAQMGRWLAATVNWAYTQGSMNNVGLGLKLHGGPIQFYIVTDNVLTPFLPQHVRSAQIMFGLNLAIGRRDS